LAFTDFECINPYAEDEQKPNTSALTKRKKKHKRKPETRGASVLNLESIPETKSKHCQEYLVLGRQNNGHFPISTLPASGGGGLFNC
jgi:hypothetical protein